MLSLSLILPPPPISTLFPYTTLFRSSAACAASGIDSACSSSSGRPSPSQDRKSTRLNSSHRCISYAVFCLKKKKKKPLVNAGEHEGIAGTALGRILKKSVVREHLAAG